MIDEADRDGDGEVNEQEFLRIMKKTNLYWSCLSRVLIWGLPESPIRLYCSFLGGTWHICLVCKYILKLCYLCTVFLRCRTNKSISSLVCYYCFNWSDLQPASVLCLPVRSSSRRFTICLSLFKLKQRVVCSFQYCVYAAVHLLDTVDIRAGHGYGEIHMTKLILTNQKSVSDSSNRAWTPDE